MPRSAPCGAAVRAALGGSLAVIALAGCGASAGRASSTTRGSGSATAVEATLAPTGGPAGGATTDQSAPSGAAASVTTGSTTSTPARTTTTPTSRATSDPVRTPQLRHLQAVLLRWLRAAGPETGALVYDMTDHATLFTVRASRGRPPASVEKLYTTVAAASLLGPSATFPTEILGTGRLEPHGVWHGNLYLRGDGDPTFGDGNFNRVYEDGYGPTASELVAQLRRHGIDRVTGRVIGDESRFDTLRGGPLTGYQPDIPDYGGELSALVYDHGATGGGLNPAAFAAHELVLTMRGMGVRARAARRTAFTPAGAHLLAIVQSPPLSVLLRLMDVPSDDLFADLIAKQIGYRYTGHGTLAAGAAQISTVIEHNYDLHPTILDGSGLDKADRSSPDQIVSLLRDIHGTPIGGLLANSLPVVGETGTVQSIADHTAAQGHCIAKTGTLDDVTNLAGYCTARGAHTLVFALLIDGPENWQALELLSKMVGAIAAY